jgi:hypothetical protein
MREERLARAFVEFSDTLVRDYDVVEFLSRLCQRSVEVLEVTAAGALLTDGAKRLQVVAASTEQVTVLETLQIQRQEGPCVDATGVAGGWPCPTFAGQPGAGRYSRGGRWGSGWWGCVRSRCGYELTGSAP